MTLKNLLALTAVSLTAFGASAHAALTTFTADLGTLNPDVDPAAPDQDPSGMAELVYNDSSNTLQVRIDMQGVTAGQQHAQHIHGPVNPFGDAQTPTLAQDDDNDGFIELSEGAQTYGPVLLALTLPNGNFPTADGNGTYSYTRVFNLDQDVFAADFELADLLPLTAREIVIHGAFLPEGAGSGDGQADGTAGYKALLPVAAGEINAVPIPGAAFLFAGTALAAGAHRRLSKKKA